MDRTHLLQFLSLLPVAYFHVVFTVPAPVAAILQNKARARPDKRPAMRPRRHARRTPDRETATGRDALASNTRAICRADAATASRSDPSRPCRLQRGSACACCRSRLPSDGKPRRCGAPPRRPSSARPGSVTPQPLPRGARSPRRQNGRELFRLAAGNDALERLLPAQRDAIEEPQRVWSGVQKSAT